MSDIKKIIAIGKELEELDVQHTELTWVLYTTGFDFGVDAINKKITQVYENKKYYDAILNCQKKKLDLLDKRRVDIIARAFKPYHLSKELAQLDLKIKKKENQLMKILNQYRYNIEGREVRSTDIYQILKTAPDRKLRKKVYLARAQINQLMIKTGFLDLIKMRCDYAQGYGVNNFIEYRLEQEELTSAIFDEWVNEVRKVIPKIREMQAIYGEKYIGDPVTKPWDNQYIGAQIASQLNSTVDMSNFYNILKTTFLAFGFDLSKYNITFDIFPRRNKSEWCYIFPVQKGRDVRVLANVGNRYHEYFALLHETGHGLHFLLLDPKDILLNMGISGIIMEGFAMLWNDLLYEKIFYKQFVEDDLSTIDNDFTKLKTRQRIHRITLIFTILFEFDFYRNKLNSLTDINNLYWKRYEELFNREPYTDNPPWAYIPHYTMAPIHIHQGSMGDITNDMLRHCFEKVSGVTSYLEKPREFGRFVFEKVIKPSGAYPYLELFKRISGEPFSLKYFTED